MKNKFPFYTQTDTMDCGSACLKMIASFYGRDYSPGILRVYACTTSAGVSMRGISKAAEHIGLKSLNAQFTLESLKEEVSLPCILHWGEKYFVVLYKIRKKSNSIFYIADPGKGFLQYNEEEFKINWLNREPDSDEKGSALILEPTSEKIGATYSHGTGFELGKSSFFKNKFFFPQSIFGSSAYQLLNEDLHLDNLHEKEIIENKKHKVKILVADGPKNIVIKNLTFQYESPYLKKALNNINLTIPQGKVTAIVGASGSGKTTLLKLLLGCYSTGKGSIHVGYFPLDKFDLAWWRTQCGVVMDDSCIFPESIAKNISVSLDEIDVLKLEEATRMANLDKFVSKLPLSYDTLVGRGGEGLSHRQKQRLLIARIVYNDPQFIFLDEVVNTLDSNNKKIILNNLHGFYDEKTVVLVSHRLKILQNVDQIVVLDNGEIVERGNHKELTLLKGKYYQLVKDQLE